MAGRVAAIFSAGGISRYTMVADSLGQGRRLHPAARDQIEVKRSLSVAQNARTQTEPMLFQSKPGNKRRPARSSLQREFAFRHEEKMTMSTKITMALVAAVIACASPALAGGNGNRDTEYTYKTAQFCIPQLDELPGTTRLYC